MTASPMSLLSGLHVVECTDDLSGRFCGRVLAQLGAEVSKADRVSGKSLAFGDPRAEAIFDAFLDGAKNRPASEDGDVSLAATVAGCDLIIVDHASLLKVRELACGAARPPVILCISPYGLTGDNAGQPASSLTLQHASGLAYHQASPVSDPQTRPPVAGSGLESTLLAGVGAASAAVWALLRPPDRRPYTVDFSLRDFIAHLLVEPVVEANSGASKGRKRAEGQAIAIAGGLVWLLPCVDGFVLISPRESHQWERWIQLLGTPVWSLEPGLCDSPEARMKNAGRLQTLMAGWSRGMTRQDVFTSTQTVRVACFPVSRPADILTNEQLRHRGFFERSRIYPGFSAEMPRLPFHFTSLDGSRENSTEGAAARKNPVNETPQPEEGRSPALPPVLTGIRVIDFSWVMAGPMATKTLALMGAEVIKMETATRPEFSRRGGWFDIINNGKRSCTLNIRKPEARDLIRRLVEASDIVVENFSAGVLDKYGIGLNALSALKQDLIFVSASGLGRTGPQRDFLAYGTLLQAYSGHTGLVGPANVQLESMGILPAWTDPVTSVWEVLAILSAIHARRQGKGGAFIDLSMLESTVSLMPDILLRTQLGLPAETPNEQSGSAWSGCFRCAGDDEWIAVSVSSDEEWLALSRAMGRPDLGSGMHANICREHRDKLTESVRQWARAESAAKLEAKLRKAGIPAARSRSMGDLLADQDRRLQNLFPSLPDGSRTTTLPWTDESGHWVVPAPTPRLGADNAHVFSSLLGLDDAQIEELMAKEIIV